MIHPVADGARLPMTRPGVKGGAAAFVCLLIVAVTAGANLLLQSQVPVNPDVAFLSWAARQVMGPAVFGVDIYEVNPPLSFLLYSPAALAAPLLGFPLAISLWVTALACLSVAMFWQCCDERLRLPLTLAFAIFVSLMFFRLFGQREHIALLLTAPYVAGSSPKRGIAALSGVMAGIGFCIKPYFLIPLVLVFATRRRIRTEEIAIVAVGLAYAATLLLFFRPWLFDLLPLVVMTYGHVHDDVSNTWTVAAYILPSILAFSIVGAPQPAARGFMAASLGFTLAALVQYKGFAYHFQPAFGYLVLMLVTRGFNPRPLVRIAAAINLLLLGYLTSGQSFLGYAAHDEIRDGMNSVLPDIDRSASFLSWTLGPLPAWPAAIYTSSHYAGMAIWPIFYSASRSEDASPDVRAMAERLAFQQAIRELSRAPDLVIVERPSAAQGWARPAFDLLAWYRTDKTLNGLWQAYRLDKTIGRYELYRRK